MFEMITRAVGDHPANTITEIRRAAGIKSTQGAAFRAELLAAEAAGVVVCGPETGWVYRLADGLKAVAAAEKIQTDAAEPAAARAAAAQAGAAGLAAAMLSDKPARRRAVQHAAVVVWDRPARCAGKMCVPGTERMVGAALTRYQGGDWRACRLSYTPPLWRDGALEAPPSITPDHGYVCTCGGCGAEARSLLSTLVRAKIDNGTGFFACPACGTEWDRKRLRAGWEPDVEDRVLGDDELSLRAVAATAQAEAFGHPLRGPRLYGVYPLGSAPAEWEPADPAEIKLRDAARSVSRDVLPWALMTAGPKPADLWLLAPEFAAGHASREALDSCDASFRIRLTPDPVDPAVLAELRGGGRRDRAWDGVIV